MLVSTNAASMPDRTREHIYTINRFFTQTMKRIARSRSVAHQPSREVAQIFGAERQQRPRAFIIGVMPRDATLGAEMVRRPSGFGKLPQEVHNVVIRQQTLRYLVVSPRSVVIAGPQYRRYALLRSVARMNR